MFNRRHLRVKVLQILYGFILSSNDDLSGGEKELIKTINKTYDLYLYQLLLISELGTVAEKYFNERKGNKIFSQDDIKSGEKFLKNQLLELLRKSVTLNQECKNNQISWAGDYNLIRKIFIHIRKTGAFRSYVNQDVYSFEQDKKFLLKLYSDCICEFEMLHYFYEEKSVYWIDDWELIVKMTIKTLKNAKKEDDNIVLMDLFKDEGDKEFARLLFTKTVLNHKSFDPLIAEKASNWDIDRIAIMDSILMKMALTELTSFPEIPVKVTFNEYIELSKIYSSQKSKIFINGILDKLCVELTKDNKIQKSGKGLLN